MRLKNNFELRNVCGENVLIPCGKGGVDLNVLFILMRLVLFCGTKPERESLT